MKKWDVTINGLNYEVILTQNWWSGKRKLTVNGEEQTLKKTSFQAFVGTDQAFDINGKECRIVILGNKADIAVDGVYVGSNKPYVPLKKMPWWTWIFVVLCMVIPIISFGGALPVVIGVMCSAGCVRVSVSPYRKTITKVLFCLGITILAWFLLILVLGITYDMTNM